MAPEVVAAIVGALALLVTTWLQVRRSDAGRGSQLKADAELLRLLPEDSTARPLLLSHVDNRVRAMVAGQEIEQRDPILITMGLSVSIMAAALVVVAANNGGWWWAFMVLAAPLALFGIVLFVDGLRRVHRTSNGRAVTPQPADPSQT
jgi:hypothetical protein